MCKTKYQFKSLKKEIFALGRIRTTDLGIASQQGFHTLKYETHIITTILPGLAALSSGWIGCWKYHNKGKIVNFENLFINFATDQASAVIISERKKKIFFFILLSGDKALLLPGRR